MVQFSCNHTKYDLGRQCNFAVTLKVFNIDVYVGTDKCVGVSIIYCCYTFCETPRDLRLPSVLLLGVVLGIVSECIIWLEALRLRFTFYP